MKFIRVGQVVFVVVAGLVEVGCATKANVHVAVNEPPPAAPEPPPPPPKKKVTLKGVDMKNGTQIDLAGAIEFKSGSAKLVASAANKKILERLVTILTDNPEISTLSIEGNSDNAGEQKGFDNQKLSQQRAQTIVDWLIKHSIERGRLQAVGYGSTHPLAPNDSPENKALNRRVEFHVLGFNGEAMAKEDAVAPAPPASAPPPAAAPAPAPAAVAPVAAAPAPAAAPAANGPASPAAWGDVFSTLGSFDDTIAGTTQLMSCPPKPKSGAREEVEGGTNDLYGWGSGICSAAVYAGKITPDKGGSFTVVYKGRFKDQAFTSKPQNGLTPKSWTGGEAFGFTPPPPSPPTLGWRADSTTLKNMFYGPFFATGAESEEKSVTCPPLPDKDKDVVAIKEFAGTNEYIRYSGVCLAATHAGKITLTSGGTVTIVRHFTKDSRAFPASTQNGLTSDKKTGYSGYYFTFK